MGLSIGQRGKSVLCLTRVGQRPSTQFAIRLRFLLFKQNQVIAMNRDRAIGEAQTLFNLT